MNAYAEAAGNASQTDPSTASEVAQRGALVRASDFSAARPQGMSACRPLTGRPRWSRVVSPSHQRHRSAGLASNNFTNSSVANSTITPRRPPLTMIRSKASRDSSISTGSFRRMANGEMPPT